MTIRLPVTVICLLSAVSTAWGQPQSPDTDTRAGRIAAEQQEKAKSLKPYSPNKAERWVKELEETFLSGQFRWHPFFESAYRGGGFTLGAGYLAPVGDYETLDVRGSWTPAGYLRFESEFRAPRLFDRRGTLSVIGGWRKATEVGYYGLGTDITSQDDRALYSFTQPYVSATLEVRPVAPLVRARRRRGLLRMAHRPPWAPARPSRRSTLPSTAPGLGATPTYLHVFGSVAADRSSSGRLRTPRAATTACPCMAMSTTTASTASGAWTTKPSSTCRSAAIGGCCPCAARWRRPTPPTGRCFRTFMMPSLGGGSDLRGFSSWRFRDRHSLLLQAEWRVLVNGFLDTAIFYDAGKVTSRAADLDFSGLKSDYGIGFRLHGPLATPLRIDLAKGNEGFHLVFSSSAVF